MEMNTIESQENVVAEKGIVAQEENKEGKK